MGPLGISLIPTTKHDIPETGATFSDNAREKARGYAKLYPGEWLLAEDSGLVVPALGGLPGPFSARYADLHDGVIVDSGLSRSVIDRLNMAKVVAGLMGVPQEKRGAYFISYIVVINPKGSIAFQVERRAEGFITDAPRGENGFGYDPIFESDTSFGRTWAELDAARKDLISHRSKAVWDLMAWLCSADRGVF